MTLKDEKIAILFNGPKYCGKDTAAAALVDLFGSETSIFRFTVPVKEETHRRFGLDVPYDHFEHRDVKDQKMDIFNGMSPREAYISVGNDLRAKHGPDVVTRMLCETITLSDASIVINPDCGGDGEAEGIGDLLGFDRVLVFRVFKAGHTYEGDCRDWVTSSKMKIVDVVNISGQISDYVSTVRNIAQMFKDSIRISGSNYGSEPEIDIASMSGNNVLKFA